MLRFLLGVVAITVSATAALADETTRAALEEAKQKYTSCLEILDTSGNTPSYQACLSDFSKMLEDYYYLMVEVDDENPIETVDKMRKQANELTAQASADMENCQQTVTSNAEFETCRQAVLVIIAEAGKLLEDARAIIDDAAFGWQVLDQGSSPIDDSPTILLYKVSRQNNTCGLGDGDVLIAMQCREGEMELQFKLNGCLYSGLDDASKTGIIRIGEAPAQTYDIIGSGDIFAPALKDGPIPLITRMFGEERLVLRAQPFSAPQQTIVFDITGLEEAITPLRDACGW